ncbi:MMPL family transporter [Actinomadura sp. 21ATH]|uniref:MMPL family transporter n=1 Tax=Actinomadura sp. 21ATH TaxID=1735444 RepID=UPI0035C0C0DE
MATLLYRLGRASFRHRRLVLVLWIVLLAALGGAAAAFKGSMSSDFSIPGTEAQRAMDALGKQFPQASGATGTIVVAVPKGETLAAADNKAAVQGLAKEASALPGVVGAVDPFQAGAVSQDGRHALIQVQFEKAAADLTDAQRTAYEDSGKTAEAAGLQVEHGGEVAQAEPHVGGTSEAIGIAVAAVVLVVTFGSLVAAGMTLLNALVGVGVGMAGLYALTGVVDMNSTAPILALMLGLAVGIDYSLFLTSRYRQNLAEGLEPQEAAGRAVGTAGSAVVFAGATVVIALAGLSVVGIPFLSVMGLAASATVAVAVLVAITLQPALLGFAGPRLTPGRKGRKGEGRHEGAAKRKRTPFGFRWAYVVTRHRVPFILAGVLALGGLAYPVTQMHLALPDAGSSAEGSPGREAYDLISEGFGPGFNGRLAAVVTGGSKEATARAAQRAATEIKGIDGVVAVTPPQISPSGTAALLSVVPESGPSDPATERLIHDIRDGTADIGGVELTGQTALGVDVSEKLADALPVYLLLVVGLSVLLLMLVFRSILVPVKAALGFLLTVGATFGITVLVFQEGHLAGLLGVDNPGPLISFLPILLIGILFGLAMDYEVFLVSRMREDFTHGDTARQATISGMGHGARVVTAAALIMIAVFGGFVLMDDAIIKSIGFALAVGVAIDAFVVRMTIVPAVMSLLDRRAWWLPRWLGRALPDIDIEGERLRARLDEEPKVPARV